MNEFGAVTEFVLAMREELAFMEGILLTGWSITYKAHTVLLIVRGKDGKRSVVLFIEAEELIDCFRILWRKMHSRNAIANWRPDKFAK